MHLTRLQGRTRLIGHFRRWRRDDRGATALEFAIVSVPYIGIMFAILYSAVAYYYSTSIDSAVQNIANQIRGGTIQLKGLSLSTFINNYLCPALPTTIDCSKLAVSTYAINCGSGDCWTGAYDYVMNMSNAYNCCTWQWQAADRAPPYADKSLTSWNVGAAGNSVYLTVVYPVAKLPSLWGITGTQTISGQPVIAITSTAIWINDPSIQLF